MDFKNVKVCPKTKVVSVNSREIKTAQDVRDFLLAPTNLIESFIKNREQKSRAGKKSKLCKGIYALAGKLFHEKQIIIGQAIYDHIRKEYSETSPCTIDGYEVWWENGRVYEISDKTGKIRDISHKQFLNYITKIKRSAK